MSFEALNYTPETVKECFSKQARVIEMLCQVDAAQAIWKPSTEEWSILEVICHLYDEECEDFRVRLAHILNNPETEWIPIDPEAWVVERNYAGQNYQQKLAQFLFERQNSIKWLSTLVEPICQNERQDKQQNKWQNTKIRQNMASITAEEMLFAWLAHDIRHIQQLSRLHYGYLHDRCSDALDYAG